MSVKIASAVNCDRCGLAGTFDYTVDEAMESPQYKAGESRYLETGQLPDGYEWLGKFVLCSGCFEKFCEWMKDASKA